MLHISLAFWNWDLERREEKRTGEKRNSRKFLINGKKGEGKEKSERMKNGVFFPNSLSPTLGYEKERNGEKIL